ncbi:MAG: hypothetical protein R2867_37500 [Caldilineaceae bacterium]
MSNATQVLVDSDAFVGLLLEKDAHHKRCTELFAEIASRQVPLVTTSSVVAETATVLSHRVGQELARVFLEDVIEQGKFPTVFVTGALHQQALEIFKMQEGRGTSMTDCVNVAIMRQCADTYNF